MGRSENAVNEPEADAIVDQIVSCINDPRYDGRTLGVISLQGEAQAKLIERKLLEALEPEIFEARRLICGDAYAFQGDERSVIFLSMVAAPNERIGTLANESARQRFNVAGSRAQDQMWLFHSAPLNVLSQYCMRHRLLSYMLSPARQTSQSTVNRFDSQFEEDVFHSIHEKGFYVRTQVCVGDPTNHRYRIDLVVEGMRGRLAVECDGDRWHGAERYEQDMARQRDLERAGWQFIRIRGGDFYRDRAEALEPLWAELGRLGISPGGIDETAAEPPPPVDREKYKPKETEGETFASKAEISAGKNGEYEFADGGANTRELFQEEDSETAASAGEALAHTQFDLNSNIMPSQVVRKRRIEAASVGGVAPRANEPIANDQTRQINRDVVERASANSSSALAEYITYLGLAGPDPRVGKKSEVVVGLCQIIETEGPMIAKRAYDIYLRGCGIHRLGGELKSIMNKSLMAAIREGQVISENEPNERGLLFSTVRIKGTEPIRPRVRGPRTFEEIPPGELRFVSQLVLKESDVEANSDEHLRAILEYFDLKRLTTQVGTTLLEIIERQDERVKDIQ